MTTEEKKIDIIKRMALKTVREDTDKIVLKGPTGEDIGEDYWVVFREANGEELTELESAGSKSKMPLSAYGGDRDSAYIEQEFDIFAPIRKIVDMHLIKEACLPKIKGKEEIIPYLLTAQDLRDKKFLEDIMPAMVPCLLRAINEFYFPEGEVEVVEELKNSPTRSESNPNEAEEAPSST